MVKVEKQLEAGPNGIHDKGASIQGLNGRNYFQDQEKAGALRVGGVWGIPGIYSEKGDVVVGSQSNKIQLDAAPCKEGTINNANGALACTKK